MDKETFAIISRIALINNDIIAYYAYIFLPLGLVLQILGLVVLFVPQRGKKPTLMLYLMKWQYVIGTLFIFNIALNDPKIAQILWGWFLTSNMPDAFCKISKFLRAFVYCLPAWFQVIMAMDRFWSIKLSTSFKFQRNSFSLTIMILIVLAVVFLPNTIFFITIARVLGRPSANNTIKSRTGCVIESLGIQFAQDLMSILMQSIVPFLVMLVLSILLVWHIRASKQKTILAVVSTNVRQAAHQKRESAFTVAVCLINGSFLVVNLANFLFFLTNYMILYTAIQKDYILQSYFVLFNTLASILSSFFSLFEFVRDYSLNRLFRKECHDFLRIVTRKPVKNSSG